jgi:type IV secretion system protein VirB3
MRTDDEDVTTDPLFVGMTRPTTMFGIPFTAFVIELMTTVLIFLAVGNPIYLALGLPIHAIMYLVSVNDPGAFDSIYIWMITSGKCMNTFFWGAKSFSPLSVKKWVK